MNEKNNTLRKTKTAKYPLKIDEGKARRCSGERTRNVYRSEFMRDRDRVLYSKAFRRLAGKAQVYISGVDDHKRTRLTHTLEVSQIARTIAEPLKLDVNLVEAIALGHDLGHTPFGHAGERTLHEIMTPHEFHILNHRCPLRTAEAEAYPEFCGFKHNLQGLVVAMKMEKNYGELGLDLTNYTLYGIQAHSSPTYKKGRIANHDQLGYYKAYQELGCKTPGGSWAWSLESMLVAEADEIAQRHHDVEDALLGGLISRRDIIQIIVDSLGTYTSIGRMSESRRRALEDPVTYDMGTFLSIIAGSLVDAQVTRLTQTAAYHINLLCKKHGLNFKKFAAFREKTDPKDGEIAMIFSYSYTDEERDDPEGFARRLKKFHGIITQRVLSSYDIQKADAKGRYIIQKIFQAYYATPQQLPDRCVFELLSECHTLAQRGYRAQLREAYCGEDEAALRRKARENGIGSVRQRFSDMFAHRDQTTDVEELILMRVICSHIAGMTDTYAQRVYDELYG